MCVYSENDPCGHFIVYSYWSSNSEIDLQESAF